MTAWIDSTLVKRYSLVLWSALNYIANSPFASETAFNTFITASIIPAAQAHVNKYCQRDFDVDYTTIPEAIKDVAARVSANMIQIMVENRAGPLIRIADYKVSMATQDPLTPELRRLLEPWITRTPYVTATTYQTDDIASRWDE